jgi:D-sedoheptulose 7-phosphate isomerase
MQQALIDEIDQAVLAVQSLKEGESLQFLEKVSNSLVHAFGHERKVLIAGNGGSLCDAMHFAEELTGYYRKHRPALPAIALQDPGHMSCVANDTDYSKVFSRHIEALGQKGDVFIALSTSGNSKNLFEALQTAKMRGLTTVAFLGKGGGLLKGVSHIEWIVPDAITSDHIQEAHMAALHLLIYLVERKMFSEEKLSHQVSFQTV